MASLRVVTTFLFVLLATLISTLAFNLTFVDVTDTPGEPRTCIFRLDGQIVVVQEQSSSRVGNISIYVDDIYPVRSQAENSDQCEYMISVLTPYDPGKPQPARKASDSDSSEESSDNESQYYQGKRIVLLTPEEYKTFSASLENTSNSSYASLDDETSVSLESLNSSVSSENAESNVSSADDNLSVSSESDGVVNETNTTNSDSATNSSSFASRVFDWVSSFF